MDSIYNKFKSNYKNQFNLAEYAQDLTSIIEIIEFHIKQLNEFSKKLIYNLHAIKNMTSSEDIFYKDFKGDKVARDTMLRYINCQTENGMNVFHKCQDKIRHYQTKCRLMQKNIKTLYEHLSPTVANVNECNKNSRSVR